jgi:F-type H+-transporting ATPase subunit epsilon
MLHFELVTPEKLVRSEDVYMVVVPGTEGDFGVLEHHAPFMSTIRDGSLAIYHSEKGEPEMLAIQGGFAEVSKSGLTVLAENAGDTVVHVDTAHLAATAAPQNKARLPDR